jgi:glycosyltransferase involved in cell wall biosynthesis
VTYDGLEDPLGQSQVRPYIDGLAEHGHRFEILSFEKAGVPARFRQPLRDGVRWTALRYHKTPTVPATAYDMLQGLACTAVTSILSRADLLHARSYVAASLMLPWKIATGVPLLFDTRGLWPDERVDMGLWAADGALYRSAKAVERILLRQADSVVVVSDSMRDYLRQEYPHRAEISACIHAIPTCTDLDRFTPQVERDPSLAPELDRARVLTYLGSLERRYMVDAMARFYQAWRRAVRARDGEAERTRFLVVSRNDPAGMRSMFEAAGIAEELVHRSARHRDVPGLVRWAEAGVCFMRPTLSGRLSAPTKLGELLACGVPVVATAVGDLASIFRGTRAATIVDDLAEDTLRGAAADLAAMAPRPEVRREAREIAERWFRLADGVAAFDRIYRTLPTRTRRSGGRVP